MAAFLLRAAVAPVGVEALLRQRAQRPAPPIAIPIAVDRILGRALGLLPLLVTFLHGLADAAGGNARGGVALDPADAARLLGRDDLDLALGRDGRRNQIGRCG